MKLSPIEFLIEIATGKTEKELNIKDEPFYIDSSEVKKLIRYGHSAFSAREHLSTDFEYGFTICSHCGSFYELGKGFTKHLSNGCLHCEGEEKHRVYHVNASEPKYGGFPARWMSQMFDDGMSYCKNKLQIEKLKEEIKLLTQQTTM